MTIAVYVAPECPECQRALRVLETLHIPFTTLATTPAHTTQHRAHHRITSAPGSLAPPIVAAENWCGFLPTDIRAVADRLN